MIEFSGLYHLIFNQLSPDVLANIQQIDCTIASLQTPKTTNSLLEIIAD